MLRNAISDSKADHEMHARLMEKTLSDASRYGVAEAAIAEMEEMAAMQAEQAGALQEELVPRDVITDTSNLIGPFRGLGDLCVYLYV